MKGIPFVTLLDASASGRAEQFGFVCEGPSMAKQSFADSCDINNIMRSYEETGLVAHGAAHQGTFDVFPDAMDYQEAMNMALDAQARFASLPAKVRSRFANDPVRLLEFLADEANRKEAQDLGLVTTPPPVSPEAPPVAPPPK